MSVTNQNGIPLVLTTATRPGKKGKTEKENLFGINKIASSAPGTEPRAPVHCFELKSSQASRAVLGKSDVGESQSKPGLELGPQHLFFFWLVENKGTPKKEKEEEQKRGELILRKGIKMAVIPEQCFKN